MINIKSLISIFNNKGKGEPTTPKNTKKEVKSDTPNTTREGPKTPKGSTTPKGEKETPKSFFGFLTPRNSKNSVPLTQRDFLTPEPKRTGSEIEKPTQNLSQSSESIVKDPIIKKGISSNDVTKEEKQPELKEIKEKIELKEIKETKELTLVPTKRKSILYTLFDHKKVEKPVQEVEIEPDVNFDKDEITIDRRKSSAMTDVEYSQNESNFTQDDPTSVFHRSALVGDLQKLKKMLKTKEGMELLNSQDKDGSYPLHKAASKNKYQAVKLLLDSGAKVDVLDKVQSTPLHWACAGCHIESTQMLCKYNAQVNIRDKYGYSPLHLCLRKKGYKCADFLLLMGADINYKREDGATTLHMCCDKGDYQTVQYLMGKPKVIANRRDKFGDTPIMMAASKGHIKIVEFLMKKDIQSCRIRNEKKENLLHKACSEGHKQVVFMVANLSPIICSSLMNEQDIYGRTPLHHAVRAQQFQIVKTLLTMGADMDTQDNSGNTALHYAIKDLDLKIIKFLVQSGCKTDLKNKNSETPKQLAKKLDINLDL